MALVQHMRFWTVLAAVAVAVASPIGGRSAAAQTTVIDAGAALNLGYTSQTQQRFVDPDPMEVLPPDLAAPTNSYAFTEVRPGISLQTSSDRFTWRIAYLFIGNFSLDSDGQNAYSNQATMSMAAELSRRSVMTFNATGTQGGTLFQQIQTPADQVRPGIRAPGNPELVTATLGETYTYEVGRQTSFGQGLSGNVSAPQDNLGRTSASLTGSLSIDRSFRSNAIGAEFLPSIAWLEPVDLNRSGYFTTTNSLLGRWNHDFNYRWNWLVSAGVQQFYANVAGRPVAFLPTGSASARFLAGKGGGQLQYSHGAATNVDTGTVTVTDSIVGQGFWNFDIVKPRSLAFSAGFLRNDPLVESEALVAAGTGKAVSADIAFVTGISRSLLATARYSLAYQYDQQDVLEPLWFHVFLVGLTATYSNTSRYTPPVPKLGRRVDKADAEGFGGTSTGRPRR